MTILQLFLENQSAIYAPGQFVVGTARVIVDKRLKTRCIKLNFHGKGFFSHHEGKVHYMTREPYMDIDLVLAHNQGSTADEFYLDPGEYTYPFVFPLPSNIPSTFKCTNMMCSIKYGVKLVVVKPWAFDEKIERDIFIREQFDVTLYPQLNTPFEYSGLINAFTFYCCNKRTLTANFQLEKRGFGQGETIKIRGVIKNDSTKPVQKLYLVLVEVLTFRCRSRIWHRTNYLIGTPLRPMAPQYSEMYENIELKVPILLYPILNNSQMVDIKYALIVTSKEGPRFEDEDNMNIPIAIGSNYVNVPQAGPVFSPPLVENPLPEQPIPTEPVLI